MALSCPLLSPLQALLKKVKEVEAGARQENIPTPIALADAEQADVLCLQVHWPALGMVVQCCIAQHSLLL